MASADKPFQASYLGGEKSLGSASGENRTAPAAPAAGGGSGEPAFRGSSPTPRPAGGLRGRRGSSPPPRRSRTVSRRPDRPRPVEHLAVESGEMRLDLLGVPGESPETGGEGLAAVESRRQGGGESGETGRGLEGRRLDAVGRGGQLAQIRPGGLDGGSAVAEAGDLPLRLPLLPAGEDLLAASAAPARAEPPPGASGGPLASPSARAAAAPRAAPRRSPRSPGNRRGPSPRPRR